jgi:hypothetical protein
VLAILSTLQPGTEVEATEHDRDRSSNLHLFGHVENISLRLVMPSWAVGALGVAPGRAGRLAAEVSTDFVAFVDKFKLDYVLIMKFGRVTYVIGISSITGLLCRQVWKSILVQVSLTICTHNEVSTG